MGDEEWSKASAWTARTIRTIQEEAIEPYRKALEAIADCELEVNDISLGGSLAFWMRSKARAVVYPEEAP